MTQLPHSAALIPAAGLGTRLGSGPKGLLCIGERTLLDILVTTLMPLVDEIVVAVPPGFEEKVAAILQGRAKVVTGGSSRQHSIDHMLGATSADLLLIQDAARPFPSRALCAAVLQSAARHGAAGAFLDPAVPVGRLEGDQVSSYQSRAQARIFQAPQAFSRELLISTGESKLYFANIIDDFSASLAMAEQAADLGADGVLLSPAAQGLSFINEVARRTGLIILSHNSCGDALTRAGSWGASDAVMATLQRAAGADMVVSPGPFATQHQEAAPAQAFLNSCRDTLGACRATLPIIQGGKQPAHLARYTADVGSTDYMIIAATWLDNHPGGIQAGARAFRDSWDAIQPP